MRALVGLICGLLIAAEACGDVAPAVQVMVLGTYHMDNPGLDLHNARADDVLTPQRQAELAAVAEALAAFKPTVIAIERVTPAPAYEDAAYREFDDSQLTSRRDERVQVGYRLARRRRHARPCTASTSSQGRASPITSRSSACRLAFSATARTPPWQR